MTMDMITIFTDMLKNGSWVETFLQEDINILDFTYKFYHTL